MNRVLTLVAVLACSAATQAQAAYCCGAANYSCCPVASCQPTACYTACKIERQTCYRTVYETCYVPEQVTCMKTVADTVFMQVTCSGT